MRFTGNWWGGVMDSALALGCSCARVLLCSGALVLWVLGAGCGGQLKPEALDVGREACAYCRMTVSQPNFASQVVAPGELPKFFDDLGCLDHYLTGTTEVPAGAVIYVTDHRTREWVRAGEAVFSRVPMLSTPMNSHLVAHATVASRDADTAAGGAAQVPLSEIVPAAWQGSGR